MTEKVLGKITKATFGKGGYDDACIGLSLSIQNAQGGTWGTFYGFWSGEPRPGAEWDKDVQLRRWGEAVAKLDQLMRECKVGTVEGLVGKPVEITTENGMFKDFRILTEVI